MPEDNFVKRLVVDSNLWISFLIGRQLGALLDIFQRIDYEFITTRILRDEIHNVAMRSKFRRYFSEESIAALDLWLNLHTTDVELGTIHSRCRDPKDDYLLELAVQSKAI